MLTGGKKNSNFIRLPVNFLKIFFKGNSSKRTDKKGSILNFHTSAVQNKERSQPKTWGGVEMEKSDFISLVLVHYE